MSDKRKAGRPKKSADESKAPGISVRLTKTDRVVIDEAIRGSGMSQSEWARKALTYIATNGIRIT